MTTDASLKRPVGATEVRDWLVSYLSRELNVAVDEIDVTAPFDRHGLSSLKAVLMIADMEEWLGCDLDPTLPYDYPTIESFTKHVGALTQEVP